MFLILSGCTSKEFKFGWYEPCRVATITKVKKMYPDIDESLLTCEDIPKPKEGGYKKQSEVASYIVDLTVSGIECKSNLKDVKILLEDFKRKDRNIFTNSEK